MRRRLASSCLWAAALIIFIVSANAENVRLAIVVDDQQFSAAADLLTAEASKNPELTLLERTQIEKIFKEQSLAAGSLSNNYLKLGQILGADGLLTLTTEREGTNTLASIRLVATRQGVVIDLMQTPWPFNPITEWPKLVIDHFSPLVAKLRVLPKEAVPISILNLRSAVSSGNERELTLLLINRLTKEKDIFVLERRQLDQLSEEKERNAGENVAFWNGSYLLEGTIDKNGFNKEIITIEAQIRAPGGEPIKVEASGKRNEPAHVIDELARKILEALNKTSVVSWKPEEEAKKFLTEARWALKWSRFAEAEAAAESAWALGSTDTNAAVLRIRTYIADINGHLERYERTELGNSTSDTSFNDDFEEENEKKFAPRVMCRTSRQYTTCIYARHELDRKNLEKALHAINAYLAVSSTIDTNQLAPNSEWATLGVDLLESSARILQYYYLFKGCREGLEMQLADLRQSCRTTAAWLLKSPQIRASYWVNHRIATHDELEYSVAHGKNIFLCEIKWGCFWLETPEDCLALYRELLTSDTFDCLTHEFWRNDIETPQVTSWADADSKKIPGLWQSFVTSLIQSTNLTAQIEGRGLRLQSVQGDEQVETAFNDFFDYVFAHEKDLVYANVETFYFRFEIYSLLSHVAASAAVRDRLESKFGKEYGPRLDAMESEYWKTMPAKKTTAALPLQKKYLQEHTPYEFFEFTHMFENKNYTRDQALELRPLVTDYLSNFVAKASSGPGLKNRRPVANAGLVTLFQSELDRIINAPTNSVPAATPPERTVTRPALTPSNRIMTSPQKTGAESLVSANVASRFLGIPMARLGSRIASFTVFDHRITGGKLWLNLRYAKQHEGGWMNGFADAAASIDPSTGDWRIIPGPSFSKNHSNDVGAKYDIGGQFEMFDRNLYWSRRDGIRKLDSRSKEWQLLNLPTAQFSQLSAINGHLYTSSDESIQELIEGGRTTKILASARRRPPVSTLDELDSFSSPTLLAGKDSLRALIGQSLYDWTGTDWKQVLTTPRLIQRPEVFATATFLKEGTFHSKTRVWRLPDGASKLDFCFEQIYKGPGALIQGFPTQYQTANSSSALWDWPENLSLDNLALVPINSDIIALSLLEEPLQNRFVHQPIAAEPTDCRLLYFSPQFRKPTIITVKLAEIDPVIRSATRSGNFSLWGSENRPWMTLVSDYIVLGRNNIPGVWAFRLADLQAAFMKQRDSDLHGSAEEAATRRKEEQALLAKYDADHNGSLDPVEKEEIIGDLDWLRLQWPLIDKNQNGFLDTEDNLSLFDANGDGVAEPNEIAAMEKIQIIIATNLVKRFDENRDGALNYAELINVRESDSAQAKSGHRGYFSTSLWQRYDLDHNQKLSPTELQQMLIDLTRHNIFGARPNRPEFDPGIPPSAFDWTQPKTLNMYKAALEENWKRQRQTTSLSGSPANP